MHSALPSCLCLYPCLRTEKAGNFFLNKITFFKTKVLGADGLGNVRAYTKQTRFSQTISGRNSQFRFTLREGGRINGRKIPKATTLLESTVQCTACLPLPRACGPKKPVTFFLTVFRGAERRSPLTSVRDLASVPTSVKVFLNVLRKSRFSSQCCSRSGTERTY